MCVYVNGEWQKMEQIDPIHCGIFTRGRVSKQVPWLFLIWPWEVAVSPMWCYGGSPPHVPSRSCHDPPSIGCRTLPTVPPCVMACSRTCSRILGLSLGTTALCAAGTNMMLLFPNWDVTYLLRGLIGRHAMLGSGLWGGGLMVSVWGFPGYELPPEMEQGCVRGELFWFLAKKFDLISWSWVYSNSKG